MSKKVDKNPRRGYYTLKVQGIGEVDLLFNMRFWGFLEEEGYKLEDIDDHLGGSKGVMAQLRFVASLVRAAGCAYDHKHDSDFTHTADDILDWLEEDITQETLTEMLEAMMKTKIFGNEINKNIDRVGKGKVVK